MTKPDDDGWRDFPADNASQVETHKNRRRWAPMSEVLETLAAAVHPDRQSDVITDAVAQIANDDGDDR